MKLMLTADGFYDTFNNPYWAALIGILAVARAVRLVTFDQYPPMVWIRRQWAVLVGDTGWYKLLDCAFCAAPYLAALDLAWAWVSDFHWTWWIVNLWAAASYLAAIVVAYDEPPAE